MFLDYDAFVRQLRGKDITTGEALIVMSDHIINLAAAMYEPDSEDPQKVVVDYLSDILFLLACVTHDAGETLFSVCYNDYKNYEAATNDLRNIFDALEVAEEINKKDLN